MASSVVAGATNSQPWIPAKALETARATSGGAPTSPIAAVAAIFRELAKVLAKVEVLLRTGLASPVIVPDSRSRSLLLLVKSHADFRGHPHIQ